MSNQHPLDNPLWYTLNDEFSQFTTGTFLAKRGKPEFIACAVTADQSEAAYADLAELYQAGESDMMFVADLPEKITGFEVSPMSSGLQYVCQRRIPVPESDVEILKLSVADIPDMAALIELTQPGPFFPDMVEVRDFFGIRQNGQLIAMAGERMKVPGYCEVTAVCTHPDWRRRGYAKLLTLTVADAIWDRGETPFLHVVPDNVSAIRVYESLEFVQRGAMKFYILKRV